MLEHCVSMSLISSKAATRSLCVGAGRGKRVGMERRNPCRALSHLGRRELVLELLDAVSNTERGLNCSAGKLIEIEELVTDLTSLQTGQPTTGNDLSATWKLLWTTEKETLFILDKAPLFGTKAGDVYQVIDVRRGLLQNVITFPPDGAFIVTASTEPVGPQRMEFKFTGAKLKLPAWDVPVPPFGQGWFDTVYLDDQIRVARDIRGDTLVVARDGLPREFS
mmetsp:Transcript_11414/g.27086  ORF Transcript_11414/g.27086 Transcript_11414/m.27086 type:complete len:222 (+) Transcript_11414:92-757(+)